MPEGYRPWACWSQKPQCMVWIPDDPATQVEPLEWEPCAPGSPGGDGCRQMKRPWWTDGAGIGATFPAVPELDLRGPRPLLRLARESRDDANLSAWWVEWDVYELDGPARFAMRKAGGTGAECGYQDYDLTEGFWVLGAIGDDTVPISESPLNGLVFIDTEERRISLPFRDDTPKKASWWAGAQGFVRLSGGVVHLHDHALSTDVELQSPASDPIGASATSNLEMVSSAVLWEVSTSNTLGIRAYDPERGPHDLVRYLDDPSRGAGTPGTDGVDLVWMEGSGRKPGDFTYPVRSIMTSPWTTDPAALQPRRLRSDIAPNFGTNNDGFRVGCGRAAKLGATPKDVQIVRLADGQAWHLPHTHQVWQSTRVVGLTCDEIFLVVNFWSEGAVQGATLQRIRFDSLGEGLPPD
jgi:hypothetical protein